MLRDLSRFARSLAGSFGAGDSTHPSHFEPPAPAPSSPEPAPAPAEDPRNRRTGERHEARVMGRLRLPASEHDCEILDLSTGGLSGRAPEAPVSVGMQVTVVAQGLPRLLGVVRWTADGSFGLQFANPIAESVIETMGRLKRRVRQPRANRARVGIPCTVYFDGVQHRVTVENVSVGGMMITRGIETSRVPKKPIRKGQALMIQFPDMLPVGGHVRWTCGDQYGVMFSKLLKLSMAEEIRRLGNISYAWIDEVREAHHELEAQEDSATEASPKD